MIRPLNVGLICLSTVCLILPTACGDLCGNEVVSETKSPDAKLKVVVFERDCGATTNFSTQISIVRSNQSLPSGGGNLFIADDKHHAIPLGSKGTMEITVSWESNSSLIVSYPQKAEVFLKKVNVAGVAVRYEAVP
jgi:hypothetical protein